MRITATCPTCGPVYQSSEIKGDHHRRNACAKAATLARAHAVATDHAVEVADGSLIQVFATRCGPCGAATPGQASGFCTSCANARLASILKERD